MGLRKATGFSDAAMPFSDSIKISESAPDQLIPETENNGSAFAKWISKVFVLENQCDGLELRLASIFYDPTNIRVYYRPKAVGFDGNINTLNWIPFNAQQPAPGEVVKVIRMVSCIIQTIKPWITSIQSWYICPPQVFVIMQIE